MLDRLLPKLKATDHRVSFHYYSYGVINLLFFITRAWNLSSCFLYLWLSIILLLLLVVYSMKHLILHFLIILVSCLWYLIIISIVKSWLPVLQIWVILIWMICICISISLPSLCYFSNLSYLVFMCAFGFSILFQLISNFMLMHRYVCISELDD